MRIEDMAKEHGAENLVFFIPLSYFIHNSRLTEKQDILVECYSEETRHRKAVDGYKVSLVSREKFLRQGIFLRREMVNLTTEFYHMDLQSMMTRHPDRFFVRTLGTDIH